MSLERRGCGIHALRPGAGGAGVTGVRFWSVRRAGAGLCLRGGRGAGQGPGRGWLGRAGLSSRPPGHDRFRAGVNFRTQAPVLPVRPSAVAWWRSGQLEALHLRGSPGRGRTRPRHGPRVGNLPRLPRPAQGDHVLRAAARYQALPGWRLTPLIMSLFKPRNIPEPGKSQNRRSVNEDQGRCRLRAR